MENCAYTNPETAEHSMKCSVISRNSSRYRRGRVTKMIVRMKVLFVIIPFWFLSTARVGLSATINAASVSYVDVATAVRLASAGDTVVIPPGSANWTQGLVWTAPANVTLKGAGTSATGGGDQTVIIDNYASG